MSDILLFSLEVVDPLSLTVGQEAISLRGGGDRGGRCFIFVSNCHMGNAPLRSARIPWNSRVRGEENAAVHHLFQIAGAFPWRFSRSGNLHLSPCAIPPPSCGQSSRRCDPGRP